MKILFCGDFVYSGNTDFTVSDELKSYFDKQDFRIINYEAPIDDGNNCKKKLIKASPHVCNSYKGIKVLEDLGIDATAIANNHIMDYGIEALSNTKKLLQQHGFKTFGAGSNFDDVYKPLVIEQNTEKIAIFNLCQAEFGVMKNAGVKAGYAWINHSSVNSLIKFYKEKGYIVIIYAHAGVEDEEYVLPEWRARYHEFIDLGASYVIASHPHIVQGIENYKGSKIVYSLGNFLFDKLENSEQWCTGLIVSIDTESYANFESIIVHFEGNTIAFADTELNKKMLDRRSSYVCNDLIIEQLADELSENLWNRYYKSYYESIVPHSIKKLLKIKLKKIFFGTKDDFFNKTMLLHNIQIESHLWCVIRYLYNENIKANGLKLLKKSKEFLQ